MLCSAPTYHQIKCYSQPTAKYGTVVNNDTQFIPVVSSKRRLLCLNYVIKAPNLKNAIGELAISF